MKIKEMGEAERPREKMLSRGPGALSDTELLAILLRGGTPKESALGIARTLLGLTDGRLSALFNMGAEKMMQVPGVGECKAATLLAAMELGRRYLQEESTVVKKPVVTSRMVYDLMIPLMKGLDHEECWIVLLNDRNYMTAKLKVTSGGGRSTTIDVRQILRMALDRGAAGVLLVHNHPTGNPAPSKADIKQTDQIRKGLDAVGITLVDHVIIADDSYFSFCDDTATPVR